MEVAAVVLAAGGSSRMGSPKQLLRYRGVSLVRRVVDAAVASRCARVCVVVGSDGEEVASELTGCAVHAVSNARWAEGLSSSIAVGVRAVTAGAAPDGVLLLLADQPHVTQGVIDGLIDAFDGGPAEIVASSYGGGCGVPALFGRAHFAALTALSGDRGARVLLERHAATLRAVAFEAGAVDVDTREDYAALTRSSARTRYSK